MERPGSNADFGHQLRSYRCRHLRSSAPVATESTSARDLFLADRARALFDGAVRALAFRVGVPFVSAALISGHGAHGHRDGPPNSRAVSNLRSACCRIDLHACARITCLGADIPSPLNFTTSFALALLVGIVAGRGSDLRRSVFLGLRKARLFAAVCSYSLASRF